MSTTFTSSESVNLFATFMKIGGFNLELLQEQLNYANQTGCKEGLFELLEQANKCLNYRITLTYERDTDTDRPEDTIYLSCKGYEGKTIYNHTEIGLDTIEELYHSLTETNNNCLQQLTLITYDIDAPIKEVLAIFNSEDSEFEFDREIVETDTLRDIITDLGNSENYEPTYASSFYEVCFPVPNGYCFFNFARNPNYDDTFLYADLIYTTESKLEIIINKYTEVEDAIFSLTIREFFVYLNELVADVDQKLNNK